MLVWAACLPAAAAAAGAAAALVGAVKGVVRRAAVGLSGGRGGVYSVHGVFFRRISLFEGEWVLGIARDVTNAAPVRVGR